MPNDARLDNLGVISESLQKAHRRFLIERGESGLNDDSIKIALSKNEIAQLQIEKYLDELKIRRKLKSFQSKYSPIKTMQGCNKTPLAMMGRPEEKLEITLQWKGVHTTGMATCSNPNCVTCAARMREIRAARIKYQLEDSMSDGEHVYWCTFTIPRSNDITFQRARLAQGWKAVHNWLNYRFPKSFRTARAIDTTFRPDWGAINGIYHIHYHCVIITPSRINKDDLGQVWTSALKECNLGAQWIEEVKKNEGLSGYVAKMAGLGLELSSGAITKKGKLGSLSLPQLMKQGEKDSRARAIYQDYLRKISGARMLDFSRNWITKDETKERLEAEKEADKSGEPEQREPITVQVSEYWHACFLGSFSIERLAGKLWELYRKRSKKFDELQSILENPEREIIAEWMEDCTDKPVEIWHRWRWLFIEDGFFNG